MQILSCCMANHILNLPLYEENNKDSYRSKLLQSSPLKSHFKSICRSLVQFVTTPTHI